jgi:hypothetical protein
LVALVGQSPKAGNTVHSSTDQLNVLKEKVLQAKEKFRELFGKPLGNFSGAETEKLLQHNPRVAQLVELGGDSPFYSSLRSRHKIVRIAYSLAIWDGLEEPLASHFSEASCYRSERFSSMLD